MIHGQGQGATRQRETAHARVRGLEAGFCERVEQRGAALDIAHELLLLRGDTLDIVASVRLATPPARAAGLGCEPRPVAPLGGQAWRAATRTAAWTCAT